MLYPKNESGSLSKELFRQPTSEYRGTPFWAWNCDLDKEELLRQIDMFREMGLGGFHMHVRSGMSTAYLSDEFFSLIGACIDKARENDMLAWLYDEDRWPSGAAGGIVTKDHAYRARTLLVTCREKSVEDIAAMKEPEQEGFPGAADITLLGRYHILLDENGCLASYRKLADSEEVPADGIMRYAYLCVAQADPWYNGQAYLNTLDSASVKKFIETTHEAYADRFQSDFGGVVPAIFTDEPQFSRKVTLAFPDDDSDAILPWTDDLEDTYAASYGESLLAHLPELFWDLPEHTPSPTRYRYHDHVTERFTEAFADQIGAWCDEHNIMLTGHMMEEPTLASQTGMLGEAMRAYRGFGLPGIDMLCDRREYTTAKQAQSAAHQFGRPGVLSELYGVTNWNYDFRGHKSQGDWQAALGVTVRVPHLSWVSMEGDAKRDYPATISYQSPWWKEYTYVEDHFARVNTALTRGKPHVRVAVIHPIESYWLAFGPASQTAARRREMDERFQNLTRWLLEGLIDFDFVCESLLPSQCEKGASPLTVGEMTYDTVIVPDLVTMRGTTLERLRDFKAAGGRLIFMGDIPGYIDAIPGSGAQDLAQACEHIPYTEYALLTSLESCRELDVRRKNGERQPHMLYQMREDNGCRWLFLTNSTHPRRPDQPDEEKLRLTVKGLWKVTLYDTLSGDIRPCPASQSGADTVIPLNWHGHDSILLQLTPGVYAMAEDDASSLTEFARLSGPVPVTLSEPSCLLLDRAEWKWDDGPVQPIDELLRVEAKMRAENGLVMRGARLVQPWVNPADTHFDHYLTLYFTINSEIDLDTVSLALEKPLITSIRFNGQDVPSTVTGWYVDRSIKTVALPPLKKGKNTLELRVPIGNRTGAEWCYLLGDFGVRVQGDAAVVTQPVRELGWGDWSTQGLPFYGGNVTYHIDREFDGPFTLECAFFRCPLITVDVDGKRAGRIAWQPYRLPIDITPGRHTIDITAYGCRINSFGCVHLADHTNTYYSSRTWRSEGAEWQDEYRLWDNGIITSPRALR